jgi:pimeloyl-ACP methyl ester carboxylesterase
MAAARHPSGLVGVVLCASFYRSPHPYLPSFLGGMVRPALLRLFPQFFQVKALLGGYSTSAFRQLVREALSAVAPEVLARRLRAVLTVDAAEELTRCQVPLLYLRGTRDFVVPRWNAADTQRLLPSASIHVIPAPHMILQTQPQLAAKALA